MHTSLSIQLNRAPGLTAWAGVVAVRLGCVAAKASVHGHAVAGASGGWTGRWPQTFNRAAAFRQVAANLSQEALLTDAN